MSPSVPLSIPLLRDRLAALAAMPLVIAAGISLQSDAVANRFVGKLGVSGINFRLSSLVDTVLKPASGAGKVEINNLIVALVALVLLGAIVFFLFGILKTMGGRRGGIETVGQVVFALVVGIAGLEVLA